MTNIRTISIPFELARFATWQRDQVQKYQTNQVIKALDTWLVLKHETRAAIIQDWNKQKAQLLAICKVSESIFRHRLKLLAEMQLIQFDRHNIRICSWNDLATIIGIKIDNKFSVQYDTTNKQRLQDWLIAAEIKDNQNRQDYSILKKVNENPLIKQDFVNAMISAGADSKQLKNADYFLSWLNVLYRQDFVKASAIHDLLVLIRPDNNRGVKTMADHWTAKHPTTVSYWKRVLQKAGIAYISKLQVESTERVRNRHCHVMWLKKQQQTCLALCDNIMILQPWLTADNTNNKNLSRIDE